MVVWMGTMQSMYSMKAGDKLFSEEIDHMRYTFSKADVESMLNMEEELRASDEIQTAYSQYSCSQVPNEYFAHVARTNKELQQRVLRAHGVLEEDLEWKHRVYLNIRSHALPWFGEVPSWVVYMRYDISAAQGPCGVHSMLPSLTVFHLKYPPSKTKEQKVLGWEDTRATNLTEFKKAGRPLVIFGASIS